MEKIRRYSKKHFFFYKNLMWIGLTIFKYHLKYLRYIVSFSNGCAILWGLERNKKDEKKELSPGILNYQILPNWNVCSILASNGFWHSPASNSRCEFSDPWSLIAPKWEMSMQGLSACLKIIIIHTCTYIYIYISRTMDAKMILAIYIYCISMVSPSAAHKTSTQWMPRFWFWFRFRGGTDEFGVLLFECTFFFFCFCPSESRSLDWQFGNLRVPGISESESGNNSEIGTITYRELATKQRHELLPRVLIAFVKKNEMESPL